MFLDSTVFTVAVQKCFAPAVQGAVKLYRAQNFMNIREFCPVSEISVSDSCHFLLQQDTDPKYAAKRTSNGLKTLDFSDMIFYKHRSTSSQTSMERAETCSFFRRHPSNLRQLEQEELMKLPVGISLSESEWVIIFKVLLWKAKQRTSGAPSCWYLLVPQLCLVPSGKPESRRERSEYYNWWFRHEMRTACLEKSR